MGTIPAPNITADIASGQKAFFTPLDEYTRAAELKQQTALEQQQAQATALQNQEKQRAIADQDALTKTLAGYDPSQHSLADIPGMIVKNGGSGAAALQAQAGLMKQRQDYLKLSDDQFAQEQKKADLIQGVHDQVSATTPETKQQVYQQGLETLAHAGVDVSQEPAQYPGDEVFAQHLPAIRLHSAIVAEAQKDRELKTKEQEAQARASQAASAEEKANRVEFPSLGIWVDTKTGEQHSVGNGPVMSPSMMESKYVQLAAREKQGLPVAPEDKAWMQGFQQYKMLVPVANFNLQAQGVPLAGAPAAQAAGKSGEQVTDAVPKNIKPTVMAVLEGRQSPPGSFALKTPYWQNVMNNVYAIDPQWNEQRAQLRKAYTTGQQSKEINAINTAMGHVGVLGDAIDALNNNDVKALNRIANAVGVQFGRDNVTTFNTIVHRVGPELSKAYIGAGGSAGERGTDEKDFDPSLGPQQLKSNVGITARLLRSKIASLENQWDQNKSENMPSFQEKFIMPEAKAQLDKWSPEKGGSAGSGVIYARDPQGRLHQAPAGTALPRGWKPENR